MKVLLAGGGTGGHVYPAIAIANKIKEHNPDCEILFVGTKNGIESEIVPKAGFELKTVTVQGFKRKIDFDNVKRVFKLCKGLEQSRRIVKKYKPDIVIGTGGYVSGPVLFNAAMSKTLSQELQIKYFLKLLQRFLQVLRILIRDFQKRAKIN